MNTTTASLYINDNGLIACLDHGGSYLRAEYDRAPEQFEYRTPLESWEKVDAEFVRDWNAITGSDPVCAACS